MTRFYYDDPLAAAWMATHHSMKFLEEVRVTSPTADRYIIRPDSLHLLEPQPGDLLLIGSGREAHQVQRATKLPSGQRIILRNGVAFHWPFAEEA